MTDRRIYRLVRRPATPEGTWHFRMQWGGKRHSQSLATTIVHIAESRARALVQTRRSGKWTPLKAKSNVSLERVVEVYQREGWQLRRRTMQLNVLALKKVVRVATENPDLELTQAPAELLSGKLVREFERRFLEGYAPDRLGAGRRSVDAYLRLARSVFNRRMLAAYEQEGLHLPDLQEFLTQPIVMTKRAPVKPPTLEEMLPLLKAAGELREQDAKAYMAWLIALCTGLRRSEILRLEWGWLRSEDGAVVIRLPEGATKAGIEQMVPVPERLARELEWWRGQGKQEERKREVSVSPRGIARCIPLGETRALPNEKIIPGYGEGVMRRVGRWMKRNGWTQRFKLHGMRRYLGKLYLDQFGVDAAQAALRHANRKITLENYTGAPEIVGREVKLPEF